MVDDATILGWESLKVELEREFPFLQVMDRILVHSQVILTTIDELRDENNPHDIDFQPRDENEARQFKLLLQEELQKHQLPTNGRVREQHLLLKSALEAQEKYKLISKLTSSTDSSTAFVAVEAAIPCILHGGNRLGEKVFMMMLLEVWRCCYSTRQKQELVQVVEHFVNTGALDRSTHGPSGSYPSIKSATWTQ
jgi:hypothetical protein